MLTLKDIMAPQVYRMDVDTTIRDGARIMASKNMGSLVVTREHEPVGIVTETDMVRRVLAQDLNPDTHTLEEVMSSPLVTVEASLGILEARDRMDQEHLRHLLVTEGDEIKGIVSARDLIHKPRLASSGG
jgi:CBS domain-containing protein